MDAKTLRAALAAAVRVTVSTSMLGCGGNVASGGAADAGSDGSPPAPSAETPEPALGAPPVSGLGGGAGMSGMQAAAGTHVGGAAGAGGGEPVASCEQLDACTSELEALSLQFDQPLPSAASTCCASVVEGLSALQQTGADAACLASISTRFMLSSARGACCAAHDAWHVQGCTPWGPPVPPAVPAGWFRDQVAAA